LSILAFAYACEPDRGSEPGAGWSWARALATLDHTWVITRANNAKAIETGLSGIPERDRLTFVFIDLPRWARFWKKGRRGHRIYYLLWQAAALMAAKRLMKQHRFEIVWHLTLANVWMGSLAPLAGGKFVFGPVGGGASAPLRLMPALGVRGTLLELARDGITVLSRYLNPLARLAWRRAELVLVQNPETRDWLPSRHRAKAVVFPNAVIAVADMPVRPRVTRDGGTPTILFAGLLQPMKGVSLAIRALERLPEWRLIICGSGPDELRLRRLATQQGVVDRVEFRGWVQRQELARVMREEADVFVFPSLRDQAGFVVAEATTIGLPSVSLDRGGPKLVGGIPVKASAPRQTAENLANAIVKARDVRPHPPPDRAQLLHDLQRILANHGLLRSAAAP
jgi:glycosyltransferase involved in cell wall biosynthesis